MKPPRKHIPFGPWMGPAHPSILGETWVESESFTYPSGGFSRFAKVRTGDGSLERVRCSIPDTFSSIPARSPSLGNGFITVRNDEFVFIPDRKEKETKNDN